MQKTEDIKECRFTRPIGTQEDSHNSFPQLQLVHQLHGGSPLFLHRLCFLYPHCQDHILSYPWLFSAHSYTCSTFPYFLSVPWHHSSFQASIILDARPGTYAE